MIAMTLKVLKSRKVSIKINKKGPVEDLSSSSDNQAGKNNVGELGKKLCDLLWYIVVILLCAAI